MSSSGSLRKEASPAAPVRSRRRAARSDGEDSRHRLLVAGLRLFAEQGFAKTSIRQIATEAGANLAAISYYFGDKAGLYRQVFFGPIGPCSPVFIQPPSLDESLDDVLPRLFSQFLGPLKDDQELQLRMKLHSREMLEPTGLWEEKIDVGIRPIHQALVALLSRRFGLAHPDEHIQRLALSMTGLGVHLFVGREVILAVAPNLLASPDAIDDWGRSLVLYAKAMIQAEADRRAGSAEPPASATSRVVS